MHPQSHRTPHKESPLMRTTSDATPSLSTLIRTTSAGHFLDEKVATYVFDLTRPEKAHGISSSWDGMRLIVDRLTALGCYVQMQVHADQSFCEILRVLEGAAVAKQLAVADGTTLPEAVARAAVIACLAMQPPGER
jgi:hypothetical protein